MKFDSSNSAVRVVRGNNEIRPEKPTPENKNEDGNATLTHHPSTVGRNVKSLKEGGTKEKLRLKVQTEKIESLTEQKTVSSSPAVSSKALTLFFQNSDPIIKPKVIRPCLGASRSDYAARIEAQVTTYKEPFI